MTSVDSAISTTTAIATTTETQSAISTTTAVSTDSETRTLTLTRQASGSSASNIPSTITTTVYPSATITGGYETGYVASTMAGTISTITTFFPASTSTFTGSDGLASE